MPDDLTKLSNVVKNEVVKKTDFSADTYVTRTKFSRDTNALDDQTDKVEKKFLILVVWKQKEMLQRW